MYDFDYYRPKDLRDAAARFAAADDPAYLSGGHTLLPTLKGRLASPDALIDLRKLQELTGIVCEDGRLIIGAVETHADVAASEAVLNAIPALAGLAGSIGDVHVRNFGTIGGSIANNDPSADYPSAVLGLGATIHTNRREIEADDFFAGLFATALYEGEIIVAVSFPTDAECGYAKFRNPASRYAMAGVFVARFEGRVRVAITGAGDDGVFRWREAEERLADDFSNASIGDLELPRDGMMSDMHGTADYRAHLAAIMTQRAVANMSKVTIAP